MGESCTTSPCTVLTTSHAALPPAPFSVRRGNETTSAGYASLYLNKSCYFGAKPVKEVPRVPVAKAELVEERRRDESPRGSYGSERFIWIFDVGTYVG